MHHAVDTITNADHTNSLPRIFLRPRKTGASQEIIDLFGTRA